MGVEGDLRREEGEGSKRRRATGDRNSSGHREVRTLPYAVQCSIEHAKVTYSRVGRHVIEFGGRGGVRGGGGLGSVVGAAQDRLESLGRESKGRTMLEGGAGGEG